uniref:Uncharacterized protein n=1 Tax=Corvus moneduloides TaxID=1196302 RepID=A0A8U7NPM3_CORMO
MAPSPSSAPVPGIGPTARAAAPALPASSAPVSAGDTGGCWAPCAIAPLNALSATAYTGFRLGNSSSGCTGRVEVAVRGTWGSVCASEWELADAHVLCRHLGCGRAFTVPPGGSFGSGDGPLRPDAFGCSGSERHPGECPVAVLGKPPCAPGNAAAVNCSGVYGTCGRCMKGFWDPPGTGSRGCRDVVWGKAKSGHFTGIVESLELVEGETRCDGWLELAISSGTWRRDILWNIDEKERAVIERVIETMQGMTTELTGMNVVTTAPPGISHGAAIVCSGGCPEKGWRWRWPRQPPQPGASVAAGSRRVRLVGSSGRCAGRVEVYSGGTWSAVCQEGWDPGTANTVCQQLGCGPRGWLSAVPAQQPAPAWLAWVGCEDGARSLWGCPSAPWNLQSYRDGWDRAPLTSCPCPHTGVRGSRAAAVTAGTVPVPTVLCVVLGTLLCVALGALAVLLCRARAWRRGGSWRVGAGTDPVWGFRGSRAAERLRRWAGLLPLPPTVATVPGKRCVSFQALAELQMPSPTLSTRSWTTPRCRSTRRCPVARVGAVPVPQLCPERGLCPTAPWQLRVPVAQQWLLARGWGCPSVPRQPRGVV